MPSLVPDLRTAWRGIRARRFSSLAHILLVALAVGASAVVFSATDAFVFNRAPYPNADRLIVFQRSTPVGIVGYLDHEEERALAARTDLFSAFRGHAMGPPVSVELDGVTRSVRTQDVELGLFDLLGIRPRWGRGFVAGDEHAGSESIVIVAEELARGVFGSPAAALGQTLDSPAGPLRVVGVMSAEFRFPTALDRIWRVTDAIGPAPKRSRQVLAVLAPGAAHAAVERAVAELAGATPLDAVPGPVTAVPLSQAQQDPRAVTNYGAYTGVDASRLFATLVAAAICLTLIVCFNVAGLELAAALERSGAYAVLTALGATRGALARTTIIESSILTGAGAAAGVVLALWGTAALAAALPPPLEAVLVNPIDLDLRAAIFMSSVALLASVLTALPVVWHVTRRDLAAGLRRDGHRLTASPTQSSVRHLLLAAQVALCVVLLTGAVLFVRTYVARVAEDTGFDSTHLATVELTRPRDSTRPAADLSRDVLAQLRAHPAVRAASRTGLPPFVRGAGTQFVWVEGHAAPAGEAAFRSFSVDPDAFETMGLRLLTGRGLRAGDTAEQVVVDDVFARRFWPDGIAAGARFSLGSARAPGRTTYEIVGVAARVRLDQSDAPMGGGLHVMHRVIADDAAPLTFVARLASPRALVDVMAAVRAVAGDATARVGWMDDRYAVISAGARIAAGLTAAFGLVAVSVAMVGLYGVTAFLVAGRRREIGIRIALGAGRRHIRRLVLGPSIRAAVAGIVAGLAAAAAAARVVDSQLFGVTASDPSTYAGVLAVILLTTLAATWRPARRATRVDPAIALRE